MTQKMPITFGIAGGIGAGKSFATSAFVARGAAKFDADKEAKKLYEIPSILKKVRALWPETIDSRGKVDARRLARIVFASDERGRVALNRLNAIVHPALFEVFQKWRQSLGGVEFAVLDAALLFETGWDAKVDYVVFVDACVATRRRRVMERGWSADELDRREARQLPLELKKARADFIVDASRDDSHMDRQIDAILERIREAQKTRT